MEDNFTTICALVFRGLAGALKKELDFYKLKYRILQNISLRNHDLIVLDIEKSHINKIKSIRTAEDLFVPVCDDIYLETKHDLLKLEGNISLETLLNALNIKNVIFGRPRKKRNISFAVFIKQDKDHEIYRHEIQAVLEKKLKSFRNWVNKEPADVELWGFYYQKCLKVCLRLTTIKFRQRNYRVSEREGALRPTVAAALVVLSNPKETDVFLDPMCGSGTIVLERAIFCPYQKIYAGDIDANAVNLTKSNLNLANMCRNIFVETWDAKNLPFDNNKFDKMVINIPWGKRYGKDHKTHSIDKNFYLCLIKEFYRVIKPRGKIIILTSQNKVIKNALEKLDYKYEHLANVKILGTWAGIYSIEKVCDPHLFMP